MATLSLIKTSNNAFLLQSSEPSQNADFSIFDLDGEGGSPFGWGNMEWEIVKDNDGNAISVEYDPDANEFWESQQELLEKASDVKIKLAQSLEEDGYTTVYLFFSLGEDQNYVECELSIKCEDSKPVMACLHPASVLDTETEIVEMLKNFGIEETYLDWSQPYNEDCVVASLN
jgi:hypothetical protein